MNEIFVELLYESIAEENLQLYKNLYETTNVTHKQMIIGKKLLVFTIV
ncbi:hypothetical protein V6B14_03755 [Sporosarcina psychrophila]